MEQEAIALRDPGVLLEAEEIEIPVAELASAVSNPEDFQVRLASFVTEWFDLSEAAARRASRSERGR